MTAAGPGDAPGTDLRAARAAYDAEMAARKERMDAYQASVPRYRAIATYLGHPAVSQESFNGTLAECCIWAASRAHPALYGIDMMRLGTGHGQVSPGETPGRDHGPR
jgi:hypothetical protein